MRSTREDLTPIIRGQRRSVNWEILPPGKLPPNQRQDVLDALTEGLTPEHKRIFEERFQLIYEFEPAFHVVGTGGFRGYIVFGFTNHDFHILECSRYGNATYVLGNDWPVISQLSKAEILSRNAHQDRIIHNRAWERELRNLFKNKPAETPA